MWRKGGDMAFSGGDSTTLISKDSEVVGDLKFSGDLEVQGRVRGNIIAKTDKSAAVRIVDGGCVEGEIHAPTVIINGKMIGDVHSSEHVELASKAQVDGNVHYQLIEMVKGAQVNGSLLYAGGKSTGKPELAAVNNESA
jgi:cytoskeletal protein CcmA (bactofilin family)